MYLFLERMGLREFFNQSVEIKSNQIVDNLPAELETIEFCFCKRKKR